MLTRKCLFPAIQYIQRSIGRRGRVQSCPNTFNRLRTPLAQLKHLRENYRERTVAAEDFFLNSLYSRFTF